MLHNDERLRVGNEPRLKWYNSPVNTYEGNIASIKEYIPSFDRRCFALLQPDAIQTQLNHKLDTIVRLPLGSDQTFVPLGVVSKEYMLVQHLDVLQSALVALKEVKISPDEVKAELTLTEYGERMRLSLYLPEKYSFDPGDGNKLALRFECFNSVEGSMRFRALMGWFRFICSNGMVVGITQLDLRRRHIGDLGISDIGVVLKSGLKAAEAEKRNLIRWTKNGINQGSFISWIEKDLKSAWGFKAATRTFHISKTGHDVEVTGTFKDNKPTTISVRRGKRVPGSPVISGNLYDLSQILAWLAKERRDLQEQLEWREQIPDLIKKLLKKASN